MNNDFVLFGTSQADACVVNCAARCFHAVSCAVRYAASLMWAWWIVPRGAEESLQGVVQSVVQPVDDLQPPLATPPIFEQILCDECPGGRPLAMSWAGCTELCNQVRRQLCSQPIAKQQVEQSAVEGGWLGFSSFSFIFGLLTMSLILLIRLRRDFYEPGGSDVVGSSPFQGSTVPLSALQIPFSAAKITWRQHRRFTGKAGRSR